MLQAAGDDHMGGQDEKSIKTRYGRRVPAKRKAADSVDLMGGKTLHSGKGVTKTTRIASAQRLLFFAANDG